MTTTYLLIAGVKKIQLELMIGADYYLYYFLSFSFYFGVQLITTLLDAAGLISLVPYNYADKLLRRDIFNPTLPTKFSFYLN